MPDEESEVSISVGDDERLYRSVSLKKEFFHVEGDGAWHLSSQAFADRRREPSVYRHLLCIGAPYSNPPRMDPNGAVAGLLAGTIRANSPIHHQSGTTVVEYAVDVRPDPKGHHQAHAIVYAHPEFATDGAFRKLKELLSRIVEENWPIPPSEEFIEDLRGLRCPDQS